MHPYLTRLGIRSEVQSFFEPYYFADSAGTLVFSYKDATENYGFAFHRVPVTENGWLAGDDNLNMIRQVFVCGSAMDALAWLHLNYGRFSGTDNLLFISLGAAPSTAHFSWLNQRLEGKNFSLLFANDLLGRVADLKTAAGIRRVPAAVTANGAEIIVRFRLAEYYFPENKFSLNAFEKKAGYRFGIPALKPRHFNSFLSQLEAGIFQPR